MAEKKFRTREIGKKKEIIVSHVTIRQSISLLLLKLIILEVIFSAIFIFFHPVLFSSQLADIISYFSSYNILFFLIAVVIKIVLTFYIVLAWLNEYYEITSSAVRHRKGIIFVRKEQLALADIQSITLHQGLIGKFLNFGTLSLFDWKWRKHEYLYAIHNPTKYLDIIEDLLPGIDEEKDVFIREHIFREDKELERGGEF